MADCVPGPSKRRRIQGDPVPGPSKRRPIKGSPVQGVSVPRGHQGYGETTDRLGKRAAKQRPYPKHSR